MSWIDVVTLLGLAIAVFQIWQVGGVARATHAALVQHATRVGDYSVLLLVPELKRIEMLCEREASSDGDPAKLSEAMHAWTQTASEVKGYLGQHNRAPSDVLEQIQGAIVSVSRVKGKVLTSQEDLLELTRVARGKMGTVATTMAEYSAALRVAVEPPATPRRLRDVAKLTKKEKV